ncbi:MAG: PQQ-dependent sugar dehydrogenase [Thermodesulfobacteriota bacterium]
MTGPHTRRRRGGRAALALSGLIAALAASCGGSGSGDDPGPGSPTPTSPAGPTPTAGVATPSPAATPGARTSPDPPALRLSEVASGLDQPLFVTAAPGDAGRLYVVEQTGRIRIVAPGGVLATPFLDLSQRVSCCGERGLLGLAFHPGYADDGRFFVNYTNVDGDTELVEFARSANPDVASPQPVRLLFTVDQPFANHNGGMLAFGPDGLLYVGLGDGGGAGDPQDNAQSLDSKLGKILRLDVDRHPEPPPGNVVGGDPDVWDFGLRNPWRFSFDRATGDLYIGDVGQNALEEIDVEPAGQGARNYGWPIMEGDRCFRPPSGCDTTGLAMPVVAYARDAGCSVTGGHVYRGLAIPGLAGRYVYGDFCSNRVFSFRWVDGAATVPAELTEDLDPDGLIQGLTSFGEDEAGELYVVSQDGSVFRIEAE